ncbi:hypothetical protein Glove_551g6 [Diversispora epigaea]|uniref:Uncharacterized protein n=1 Tax=Diversispora epigaea TaxID=1348612 RepID=A0A397GDB4_9GLOM|nr:hypothetical protein Glove_551g6 [Diversispora epigaea]
MNTFDKENSFQELSQFHKLTITNIIVTDSITNNINRNSWKTFVCRFNKHFQSSTRKEDIPNRKCRKTKVQTTNLCFVKIKILRFDTEQKVRIERFQDSSNYAYGLEKNNKLKRCYRNTMINEAIKQKNEVLSEIVERELSREEKDPNYEVTYTLKDLNRVKNHLDLIKHHVWIRNNILVDNGRTSTSRDLTRQTENQNSVTVKLPTSNSTTTSSSATAISPEQVIPRVATPSNNWDQLQNFKTFYQPLNFNLLNCQLAKVNLDIVSDSSVSSDTDTEDEMANAVLDYLKDNLHNHISLRVDPFYGDGTQDPLQWMIYFEKVTCSNAWDVAKKIRKYATYLKDDAEEWYNEINPNDMTD